MGKPPDGHDAGRGNAIFHSKVSAASRIESNSRNRTRTGLTSNCQAGSTAGTHIGRMRCNTPEQRDPETTISRRTLVHGLAAVAGATVAGASGALAQADPKAARWRRRPRSPARRAISVRAAPRPPISGTPTLSRSTRPSTTSPSPTRRSSACIPGCCGPKARPGARRAAICCGATFPTTGRCDGRRTTVTSASSARRPTTQTATRSISRAGSSPANISPAGWCAMSMTAPRPCWPIISAARS